MKYRNKKPQSPAKAFGLVTEFHRRLGGLTQRQREIAFLAGRGGRNKEIANRLKIAERTVKVR